MTRPGSNLRSLDRVRSEMRKHNSRTLPGLFQEFSFFKDSISTQFCIKHEKMLFFSAGKVTLEIEKRVHLFSLILILVIKTRTTAKIE